MWGEGRLPGVSVSDTAGFPTLRFTQRLKSLTQVNSTGTHDRLGMTFSNSQLDAPRWP
jgi:hypothetical protein